MKEYKIDSQEVNDSPFQNRTVVSMGNWIVTLLIMLIPIVNFVMLFVWAFSNSTPQSKSNWAKATLVFTLVGLLFTFIFWNNFY